MKKVICFVMAILMLVPFAGCGKKEQETQESINWTDVGDKYGYVLANGFWEDDLGRIFSFEESGEYTVINGELTYSGKWYLLESDGVLSLEFQGGIQEQYYLTKLSNSLITMTDEEGTEQSMKVREETAPTEVDGNNERQSSDFGYEIAYDEDVFAFAANDNGDVYRGLKDGKTLDEVYMAFRRYSDNSAVSLAGGIEIQSDYEVTEGEESIGRDGYTAVTVSYQTETAQVKFYLIETGEDVLEIETCVAAEYSNSYGKEIEKMLSTVVVK